VEPETSPEKATPTTFQQAGTRSTESRTLPLEHTSRRLGFKNLRTLMSGSIHKVWRDHQLYPATSANTWPIRISVSHMHKRSKRAVPMPDEPFHMLHLDLMRNPFPFGITPSTNYSAYLFIVVTPGKLVGWVGLIGESSRDIYNGLKRWLLETQLRGRINRIRVIRADAGSAFVSPFFTDRCDKELDIKIEAAAPHHQEQNGMCESKWKELHTTANTLLNNARLGGAFFHHAHQYAAEIINRIPARGIVDEHNLPTTPYYICYRKKPSLENFRVFGCPAFFKRYEPTSGGKKVTKPQQIQRAARGIFVGFPANSAGWLIYSAETRPSKLIITYDVHFDELFQSALSFDSKPFAGSVPIRTFCDPTHDEDDTLTQILPTNKTGSPADHGIPSSHFTQHVDSSPTDPVEEGPEDEATSDATAEEVSNEDTPETLMSIENDYFECDEPSPRQ
jgi:hypothetical protein